MPSIFVWKAKQNTSTIPSSTTIQYYSGANWFLEEHPTSSKSAVYLNQYALQDGWMFDIKWMPHNWVGFHLLESCTVSYSLIKEDNYARLEQLGNWMRATTKMDVPYGERESEWVRIQQWATNKQNATYAKDALQNVKHAINMHVDDVPCLINLSVGSYINTGISQDSPRHFYRNNRQPFYQKKKMIST